METRGVVRLKAVCAVALMVLSLTWQTNTYGATGMQRLVDSFFYSLTTKNIEKVVGGVILFGVFSLGVNHIWKPLAKEHRDKRITEFNSMLSAEEPAVILAQKNDIFLASPPLNTLLKDTTNDVEEASLVLGQLKNLLTEGQDFPLLKFGFHDVLAKSNDTNTGIRAFYLADYNALVESGENDNIALLELTDGEVLVKTSDQTLVFPPDVDTTLASTVASNWYADEELPSQFWWISRGAAGILLLILVFKEQQT